MEINVDFLHQIVLEYVSVDTIAKSEAQHQHKYVHVDAL